MWKSKSHHQVNDEVISLGIIYLIVLHLVLTLILTLILNKLCYYIVNVNHILLIELKANEKLSKKLKLRLKKS